MPQTNNFMPLKDPLPIAEQVWPEGTLPLVSICGITYNHELYIRECLEGFLLQKTTFPVEIIIHEDASTDNTADIIREYEGKYPVLFRPIYQEENQYSKNQGRISAQFIFPLSRGKYIAICEGDDYWTDPLKLQKQVDFLENNPDYGLVHGDVNHLYADTGVFIESFNKTANNNIPSGYIFDYLIRPIHLIKTMTVCFRKDLLFDHYLSDENILQHEWSEIDISIWLTFALNSKIYYFDEVFATYRLSPESASRSENYIKLHSFRKTVYDIRLYYVKKYKPSFENELNNYFNKAFLVDAFNMWNKELAKQAFTGLKKNKVKLNFKEMLFLIGSCNKVINTIFQKIIKFIN